MTDDPLLGGLDQLLVTDDPLLGGLDQLLVTDDPLLGGLDQLLVTDDPLLGGPDQPMLSDPNLTTEDLERLIAVAEQVKAERQAALAKLQAEVLVLRAWNIAHGLKTPPPQES